MPPLWEHSLTTLLGHDTTSEPGIALRHLVHFQGVHNILDLLSWDQEELKTIPAQQEYSLDDHGQGLYLRTNQIKQIHGLITYMKHIFGSYNSGIAPQDDPFHPFTPDEWTQQTPTQMRTYLIQHLPDPHGPEPVPSGPISSAIELLVTEVCHSAHFWGSHGPIRQLRAVLTMTRLHYIWNYPSHVTKSHLMDEHM